MLSKPGKLGLLQGVECGSFCNSDCAKCLSGDMTGIAYGDTHGI